MKRLYKCTEWQGASGKWYCNDVEDLASVSSQWWIPARILDISLIEYVLLMWNTFKVSEISYRNDVLIFSWDNLDYCRKYKNYINKKAREKHYIIEKR